MSEQGIEAIKAVIPHRPPFLFVDRIIEVDAEHAVAERCIRADEPHFAGHYPGNPIMPGVLLCEACFQTAAVLMAERLKAQDGAAQRPLTPILARIGEGRFKQIVRPGETVRIEVSYKESLARFHFLRGKILKDGKVAMSVEFGIAMVDEGGQ